MSRSMPLGIKASTLRAIRDPTLGHLIHVGIVEVTPEMASRWLGSLGRPKNRTPSKYHIEKYKNIIQRGEWTTTHQGILFDEHGELIDGQHRLHALVETGQTLPMMLTAGLSYDSVMPAIDRDSMTRRLDHILQIRGEKYTTILASALRWVYLGLGGPERVKTNHVPSSFELISAFEVHPEIRTFVARVSGGASSYHALPNRGIFVACCYLFSRVDSTKAAQFMEAVITGTGLDSTDPRWQLRERYIRTRQAQAYSSDKLHPLTVYCYTVMAWNNFYRGAKLKRLQLPPGNIVPSIAGFKRSLPTDGASTTTTALPAP